MAPHHSTHSPRSKLEGDLETMACDNTSGICIIIYGMAQWLWFLGSRWQRKALAAGALSHSGCVDVCWTACLPTMSDHTISWITSSHPVGWMAIKVQLRSPDRNLGVCCVLLRSCRGAFQVTWIYLQYQIYWCYYPLYVHYFKQPPALHFRRHQQLVCVLLCSWTCSSSFFAITVSTV
jgi:hypothetical protein